MRNILNLLLPALLLASAAGAQTIADQTSDRSAGARTKPFTVKWNPASLAFGKVSLHGEYNFKHRRSITFGLGLPTSNSSKRKVDGDDIALTNKTFSLQAGYRMYLGKKTMTGFYFEPYLKYLNYKGVGTYTYNDGLVPEVYEASVDHSAGGLGAQLGVQFMIAKVIALDLFLLGPEANVGKSEALFRQVSGSPVGWNGDEVADFLRDLPLVGNGLEITVDDNNRTVLARRNGFVPGLRFGVSVGVHF